MTRVVTDCGQSIASNQGIPNYTFTEQLETTVL